MDLLRFQSRNPYEVTPEPPIEFTPGPVMFREPVAQQHPAAFAAAASSGELDIVAILSVFVASRVVVCALLGLPPQSTLVATEESRRSKLLNQPLVLDSDSVDLAQVI